MNAPTPSARNRARRSVLLALVHVALVLGVLGVFVYLQMHKG